MVDHESDLHRKVYDLLWECQQSWGDVMTPDPMIEGLGLRFEYRVVTSLGSLHYPDGQGNLQNLETAEGKLTREKLYIDSLRNTAPEFRQARISALRIERRIVGAWE